MAITLAEVSREDLAQASRGRGEPGWLTEARLRAWDLYTGMQLPHGEEAWRRTDLRRLDLGRSLPGLDAAAAAAPALQRPRDLPAGVVVTDLETAAREHPDLVHEHLGRAVKAHEHIFTALHAALWRGGAFIYVPAGVTVEEPIQILTRADGSGAGLFGHTLVVTGPGAEVTVGEYLVSGDLPGQTVQAGAVEILAGPGSRVRYSAIQNWGGGVWSFTTRRAVVGRDARVDWLVADFGGELVRSEQRTVLDEPGAEGNLKLVFFGSGEQHIDIVAEDLHLPGSHRSRGDILGRGVLSGQSRAVFRGVGHIMRGAKGCECFLRENALLLNRGPRVDSIPSLFIDDDDVARGGHAATSGKVDEDELFYLMSRGIPRAQAKQLIVSGFLAPVLAAAGPALQQEIQSLVDRKLGV